MSLVKKRLRPGFTAGLIAAVAIILSSTLLLSYRLYLTAYREIRANRGHQLLELADTAANSIQHLLLHLADNLKLLASFPGLQYFEPEPLRSNVDHFFRLLQAQPVSTIFVVDHRGEIVYAVGRRLPQWALTYTQRLLRAPEFQRSSEALYSPVFRPDPGDSLAASGFTILTPLVQYYRDSRHPHPSHRFMGAVGYLVDFNELIDRYMSPLQPGRTGFAWLIDGRGRLLFHPRHPEMVFRSLTAMETRCQECHDSFAPQLQILQERRGIGEYQVGDEPKKLMAHVPISLGRETWYIAVSVNLSEVTYLTRRNFQLFFWLIALVVGTTLAAGWLVYRLHVRRMQAELSARVSEEKRQMQAQIDQAARLASVGELVDYVAHEINTPLGIIQAQLGALKLSDANLSHHEVLRIIEEQTRRMGNYTRRLLRMSRRMPFQPQPACIQEILEDCLVLLGHALRAHHIHVQRNWPRRSVLHRVDAHQMQQVFLNLLKNAIDALDGAGEITISVKYTRHERLGKCLLVEIADNGPGISPEDQQRIFDPFFSTKSPDRGTGLGLPISRAIVERHGGRIELVSQPGRGSRFRVLLPVTANEKEGMHYGQNPGRG